MGRAAAAVGSAIFFLVAPGLVAYLLPYVVARSLPDGWEVPEAVRWIGLFVGIAGTLALIECFIRFVTTGRGTPAPVAPTRHLVVSGLYAFVRNPMYVAVLLIIVGQSLWFASIAVVAYAAIVWVAVTVFVVLYEEPTLARTFGAEYDAYRAHVRRWIPRLAPWTPPAPHDAPGQDGGSTVPGATGDG